MISTCCMGFSSGHRVVCAICVNERWRDSEKGKKIVKDGEYCERQIEECGRNDRGKDMISFISLYPSDVDIQVTKSSA